MKKILFAASVCACTLPSFAQNGLYLAPSVGIGVGNATDGRTYGNFGEVKRPATMIYNGKIAIGYQRNNWRIQTGVQFFNSQYKLKGALFSSDFDPGVSVSTGNSFIQNTYKHIGIPLQLGYVLRRDKKLSIVPYLGILAGYNFRSYRENISVSGAAATDRTWHSDVFDANFNRISLWGTAAVHLEYKLSSRISIIGGPSLQYMISNFRNNPSGTIYKSNQHNYTLSLDAGVKIKL